MNISDNQSTFPTVDEMRQRWANLNNNVKTAAESVGRKAEDVRIVAVSKVQSTELVEIGLAAEINLLGESYAQELKEKHLEIEASEFDQPEWHFIGHLQTNKVKYIAEFVDTIHSVDSAKLAAEIGKQAKRYNRTINILLQVNSSGELSKSGVDPEDVFELAEATKDIENINIIGLMTIGSFSDDENVYRGEFRLLKSLLGRINEKYPAMNLKHLSMGMTHDYQAAVEEGATFVRVGTAVFGPRDYKK
ncbi:MAG: YggS family pyridoxal phosphate-dependent enzyme [Candidatus Kapabacteria bacterium]|jgi:pyridoxal phosphate enzyme (YggS family)|nr:YggS family pyridoxal phosphate-dependent enzyme [Candidatus Kapabacteria bacterium]